MEVVKLAETIGPTRAGRRYGIAAGTVKTWRKNQQKETKMLEYRHGDVGLKRVSGLPKEAKREARTGDVILAEGEQTGHAHRIADKTVTVWSAGEQRYIEVTGPAILDHEEHNQIVIEPGIYQVIRQREYSDVGLRDVQD